MNSFLIGALAILLIFAIWDLVVGVGNDAVNFLNSSFGSKVASKKVILIIASLGVLAGTTFSSGMMEVARKGIFHPALFTMPELVTIFLAVMLTDVFLLDFFNTHGFPTSTTVSIVFELLGGAVALSIFKIVSTDGTLADIVNYINTSKALLIVSGILLSVVVAFTAGAFAQFVSRVIFSFNYENRLKHFGAVWGGVALSSIVYFILVKGAKGTSFLAPETVSWIKTNTWTILGLCALSSTIFLQILHLLKFNILKPIVLIGTFGLALAFAANDLVNFIGVPLAGFSSYFLAQSSANPLTASMADLAGKTQTHTGLLLLAGLIMIATLWLSKKARTVTETELSLSRQDEGSEKFESIMLARVVVRFFSVVTGFLCAFIPTSVKEFTKKQFRPATEKDDEQCFDLVRASVNLMVASAVVSYATSYKLPLSTTYVTFMVAMGTSFADRAWGRDSAVYRVSGVFLVIGGWFMTAFMAFSISGILATIISIKFAFAFVLLAVILFLIFRNHKIHVQKQADKSKEDAIVFNLKKITDVNESMATCSKLIAHYVETVSNSMADATEALFNEDLSRLRQIRREHKRIQKWSNILIANIFKVFRLHAAQEEGFPLRSQNFTKTITLLQEITEAHRDMVTRCYKHLSNHHKPLLMQQKSELRNAHQKFYDLLSDSKEAYLSENYSLRQTVEEKDQVLCNFITQCYESQVMRIKDESSKTRLTILFFGILENMKKVSKRNLNLLKLLETTNSN